MNKIFNLANLLSISRIFAAIPLVVFLINIDKFPNFYYSIFVIIFIVISDILDGHLARKNNYVTNFGKIIDPVADKVCLMVVLIYLMSVFKTPFFIFFILLSIRDIVLISFSLYFLLYTNHVPQANSFGKLFIFFSSIMIIFYIYSINDIMSIILYFISLSLLLISLFSYVKSHLKKMNV